MIIPAWADTERLFTVISVALKLLPQEVVSDANRRKRFLAEAKTDSALNHPNVCTIYEVREEPTALP